MQQILDLHIHSKYSRACSPQLTLPNIEQTCRIKGVDIIATGDFTYSAWFKDIKNHLEEIGNTGLYKLKTAKDEKVKFILSTELSLIYKDKGKCRRIHIMVTAPNIEAVEELNKFLDQHYNIRSDGRPILGMKAPDLVKLCLKINPKFLIYPAHIWTPWFSVFGSKSGFDSMEECFDEQVEHIYALETGLSSDPEMNWRVSALDRLTILSNSDAHSLINIGREANVFDLDKITYDEIYQAIKKKDKNRIKYTIEFYPEEGMYHLDGHRNCQVSFTPEESKKHKNICPKCKKPLVIGVMNRVEQLADRLAGVRPNNAVGYKKLVELDKIIAESLNIKSRHSKQVTKEYHHLINQAGSELHILLEADLDKLKQYTYPQIVQGITKVRTGDLIISPGYDGQYGTIKIFEDHEKIKQKSMF
ncbi:MAG: endonuclease Q family protein [bacterium]